MDSEKFLLEAQYVECLRRANQLEALGHYAEAMRHANQAIRVAPELAGAYYVRGRLRRLLDSTTPMALDQAAFDFRELLRRDPRHAEGWRLLANTTTLRAASCSGRARDQLLEDARQAFHETAKLDPKSSCALLDLAEVGLCLGRYPEAVGYAASSWSVASGGHRTVAAWLAGIANGLLGRESAVRKRHDFLCSSKAAPMSPARWNIIEVDCYLRSLHDAGGTPDRCMALAVEVHQAFQALFGRTLPVAAWQASRPSLTTVH